MIKHIMNEQTIINKYNRIIDKFILNSPFAMFTSAGKYKYKTIYELDNGLNLLHSYFHILTSLSIEKNYLLDSAELKYLIRNSEIKFKKNDHNSILIYSLRLFASKEINLDMSDLMYIISKSPNNKPHRSRPSMLTLLVTTLGDGVFKLQEDMLSKYINTASYNISVEEIKQYANAKQLLNIPIDSAIEILNSLYERSELSKEALIIKSQPSGNDRKIKM